MPCPNYIVQGQDTYLALEVMRSRPPTVAVCRRMVTTFDMFIQSMGVKELALTFGVGLDYGKLQGSFGIGLGRRPTKAGDLDDS